MDTGVGHKVGLELVQIDVEGTVESQRRGDGADDLGDETVQVLVARAGNIEVPPADVVDSLVVDEECTVGVLDGAVRRKHGVVGLDNCCRDSRGRVYGELKLALLAVLGR